jgi:DNA-binding SARP family transcriptional activator
MDFGAIDAAFVKGRVHEALRAYQSLAGGSGGITAGLAWRYGAALYMWGDPNAAVEVLRRAEIEDCAAGAADSDAEADEAGAAWAVDRALALAWTASACWLAGDQAGCEDFATRAETAAAACADRRAVAAAEVAMALRATLTGEPAAIRAHYARALTAAEEVGDVVQATRVRVNLAVGLEREARYAEALEQLEPAVALAEQTGHVLMHALGLINRAAMLHRLGRLDQAVADFRAAADLYQRADCRKLAYALNGLGDVHRLRGATGLARVAYEEAIRAAEADRNRQALVPGLAGLARVIAEEQPDEAAAAAARAVDVAVGTHVAVARLAVAAVALARGDHGEALAGARAAARAARPHRDHTALAEALEIEGRATPDAVEAHRLLTEAKVIWEQSGADVECDRLRVVLARMPGATAADRASAGPAGRRLAAAGVGTPEPPAIAVQVRVLGRFRVLVGATEVPASAWQSRKARDLLRILVSRRGVPVPREEMAELLWASEGCDDARAGHRLAVALSVARGVLDPGRWLPADHFITGDAASLALRLDRLVVDVEDFLIDAQHALRSGARPDLAEAEQRYSGEAFADDPYADWARPLRDEARATHTQILHALAANAEEPHSAIRYLNRVLTNDPYDERAHRTIVEILKAQGRHGEAHRARTRFEDAMAEIGVV